MNRHDRATAVAMDLAWFTGFLLIAIASTWPLARGVSKFISDLGDPLLNVWILDWDHWATLHQPFRLFDANIFYPARYALAFSENEYGIALVTFPLYLAGVSPLGIYNVALLVGFAFSGYGAFVLARRITGSPLAALAAGVFFELVPFRFNHLPHLQHIWSGWLPLLFAALLAYAARPSWRRAILFAAVYLINGLSNIHWLLFGSVAAIVVAIFLRARRGQSARVWMPIVVTTLCSAVLLLPFLLPYQRASEMYGMTRSAAETAYYSASAADWLIAPPANALYGSTRIGGEPERWLFPGILSLLLAAAAVLLSQRDDEQIATANRPGAEWIRALDAAAIVLLIAATWLAGHPAASVHSPLLSLDGHADASVPFATAVVLIVIRFWFRIPVSLGGRSLREITSTRSDAFWSAVILCVVGFLGSLGLHAFFHRALFHVFAFQSIRVPARWAMIAYVGLAMLVATGIVAITSRVRSPLRRRLVAAAFVALFLYELRPRDFTWCTIVDPAPAAATWLAKQSIHGGVLEVPVTTSSMREVAYLLPATVHHKPLLNGASGFNTLDHTAVASAFAPDPIPPSTIALLQKLHCSVVIVHADDPVARSTAMRTWLRENLASGRLRFLGRFDRGIFGDYAFATSVDGGKWPAPDRMANDALVRFLDRNAPSYNPSAVATVDTPKPGEHIVGSLRIAGWAVAPRGVREVRLHLQNDSVVVKANCMSRIDVNRLLPWYPEGCGAGFEATIRSRPSGVLQTTDVVVEVIDGDGASKRFPPVFFRWYRGASAK